jgi:hypothetical protein
MKKHEKNVTLVKPGAAWEALDEKEDYHKTDRAQEAAKPATANSTARTHSKPRPKQRLVSGICGIGA